MGTGRETGLKKSRTTLRQHRSQLPCHGRLLPAPTDRSRVIYHLLISRIARELAAWQHSHSLVISRVWVSRSELKMPVKGVPHSDRFLVYCLLREWNVNSVRQCSSPMHPCQIGTVRRHVEMELEDGRAEHKVIPAPYRHLSCRVTGFRRSFCEETCLGYDPKMASVVFERIHVTVKSDCIRDN